MADTALIIIARYPEPGKTKTRLARAIGEVEAARLYQAFLTDLAQRFVGSAYDLHWVYTPIESDFQSFISGLVPSQSQQTCFPQEGSDLGTKLLNAFQWTHEHQFKQTILIGSDSPHISVELIDQARIALEEADVVLGPADDGGYYLIAMRHPYDVFSAIPMSTDVVLQMTIELAQRQGLRVHLLDALFDIDEFSDLLRLAQLLETERQLAPFTAAHLKTIRSLLV